MYCSAGTGGEGVRRDYVSKWLNSRACQGVRTPPRTLELCGKDAVVLLAERALLLVDGPAHDVLDLLHREECLTRVRVYALRMPKRGAQIGAHRAGPGACAHGGQDGHAGMSAVLLRQQVQVAEERKHEPAGVLGDAGAGGWNRWQRDPARPSRLA